MIDKDGSLRCDSCNKEILLSLILIEGETKFYCPRCRYYQEIKASTTQVSAEGLTRQSFNGNLLNKK